MQDLDSALALVGTLRQEKEALRAECHELRGTVIQASHDNAALSDELVSPFRLLARISRRFFIIFKIHLAAIILDPPAHPVRTPHTSAFHDPL
jgi:hypothetical protein